MFFFIIFAVVEKWLLFILHLKEKWLYFEGTLILWQTLIHICLSVLLYSFIRVVNRNIALLYCIYYHVKRSTWNMSACWEWWETQRGRLLFYRWMEMIVNDIHAHPLHCSSAVNNKTPFHYALACSLGLGGIWLPAHPFHNLLILEGETCLIVLGVFFGGPFVQVSSQAGSR